MWTAGQSPVFFFSCLYYKLLGRDFKLSNTWIQEMKEREGPIKVEKTDRTISQKS